MRTFIKIALFLVVFTACDDMIYKDQPLVLTEGQNYKDWVDYRSAELGLYALQQELVDQIIILGEVRGDLVKVSADADRDLIEIQNFDVSSTNIYASANNFYKLIAACNSLIRTLELNHPEVLEDDPTESDYHNIYGEALCMRGWAYFNAARIYGKIPYIPQQLTDYKDVVNYIMNPDVTYYVDSIRYTYDQNGLDVTETLNDTIWYPVDTVYIDTVHFDTYARRFIDLTSVVDSVNYDLTQKLNFVGVEHGKKDDVDEDDWEAIIWTEYSKDYLLGQMAMTIGDINSALEYFSSILNNEEHLEVEGAKIRYGLDDALDMSGWSTIFDGININEDIFTIWFGKSDQQTHQLERLFDNRGTNLHYLRPTNKAILLWETEWLGQDPENKDLWSGNAIQEIEVLGEPGDFYRGHGVSYVYRKGDIDLTQDEVEDMLEDKKNGKWVDVEDFMRDVDTLVYKYSNEYIYQNDANIHLYRASSVHLYASEICTYSQYSSTGYRISQASQYLDGSYNLNPEQLGVRGRVDLQKRVLDFEVLVLQDPFTNEITGTRDFVEEAGGISSKALEIKREYFQEVILDERGKELAFEGERFYDIVRMAQRHQDPSYLADMIADTPGKYSSDMKEEIRAKLMIESNWYIPFYLIETE